MGITLKKASMFFWHFMMFHVDSESLHVLFLKISHVKFMYVQGVSRCFCFGKILVGALC